MPTPEREAKARRRLVLIVDDSPVDLDVCRRRLERAGYACLLREMPLGTAAIVLRERPDAVLMDVGLPGLSGDQIASLLRRNDGAPGPMVILHSGLPVSALEQMARECGAIGFIQKTGNNELFISQFNRLFMRGVG